MSEPFPNQKYWDSPERRHCKPKPLYGGKYGKSLIGYVCGCCDRIFSPNMRPTGAFLSNQPPPDLVGVEVHQAPYRAPHFHHNMTDWGRRNKRHATRVAARSKGAAHA